MSFPHERLRSGEEHNFTDAALKKASQNEMHRLEKMHLRVGTAKNEFCSCYIIHLHYCVGLWFHH